MRFCAQECLCGVKKCMHCMQMAARFQLSALSPSFQLSASARGQTLDPKWYSNCEFAGCELRVFQSPVPKSEGPGAPSAWLGKVTATGGTLGEVGKGRRDLGTRLHDTTVRLVHVCLVTISDPGIQDGVA
jgi:hypothetical protein